MRKKVAATGALPLPSEWSEWLALDDHDLFAMASEGMESVGSCTQQASPEQEEQEPHAHKMPLSSADIDSLLPDEWMEEHGMPLDVYEHHGKLQHVVQLAEDPLDEDDVRLSLGDFGDLLPDDVIDLDVKADQDEQKEEQEEEEEDEDDQVVEKEFHYLKAQLEFLQSRMAQTKKKRQRLDVSRDAIATNTQLHELVTKQQAAMTAMQSMLIKAPVNDVRLTLLSPLETFIHLGTCPHERRQTLMQLRDAKLHETYKYLQFKSHQVQFQQPPATKHGPSYYYLDVFERFGKMYSVHFSINTFRNTTVPAVMTALMGMYDSKRPPNGGATLSDVLGYCSVKETYDAVPNQFVHQRVVSELMWTKDYMSSSASTLPVLDANSITFVHMDADMQRAIVATDHIDQDDLHPYDPCSHHTIRKDSSIGVLVEATTDDDGTPCVVMKRFLMSKYHLYQSNVSEHTQRLMLTRMPVTSQQIIAFLDERIANQSLL